MTMRFKHLMPCVLAAISLVACNNQDEAQWEYKVVTVSENLTLQEQANRLAKNMAGRLGYEGMVAINFDDPTFKLNELGKEGWELVSTYTTTETIFPNMGNADYHTGIKENTRTQSINFVFKRAVNNNAAKGGSSPNNSSDSKTPEDVMVVEDVVEPYDTTACDTVSVYGY